MFCFAVPGAVFRDEGPGVVVAVSTDDGLGAVVVVSTDDVPVAVVAVSTDDDLGNGVLVYLLLSLKLSCALLHTESGRCKRKKCSLKLSL